MSERFRQDAAAAVTGGARGIGFAVAERLARAGVRVALWDLDRARAESSARELAAAGKVIAVAVDITDEAAVGRALAETTERLGKLDIYVNNAGIAGASKTLWDYTPEEWRQVFRINVEGMYLCCRAVVPQMIERGYGRIVNVASIAGKEGNPMAGAYSSSKAAVIGVTKAIGKDVAGTGILVNCIAPAVINTPILSQISQEHIDYMTERIPLGRVGEPPEVAALICWLASEEMSFSTGACFDISGGRATY